MEEIIIRIGVVLPSYMKEEKEWLKLIKRFYDSLKYIEDIDNLIFLCNWQNLKDTNDINFILELFEGVSTINSTWEYKYIYNTVYKTISMCVIRNDSMKLDQTCDLYLFVDDDMYFKEGSLGDYISVIKNFEQDPKLGLVMCAGYLGGYNYTDRLRYDDYKHYMTNRGLFMRNIHRCTSSPLYPEELFSYHRGGYEDTIAGFEIMKAGYKSATKFNCSTQHPNIGKIDRDIPTDSKIHNPDVSLDSFSEYLRNEFNVDMILNGVSDIRKAKKRVYDTITI